MIEWLVSNSGTPDSGAPYTIVIPEEVEFEIENEAFDLSTLSGDVTVTIEGDEEEGGELKFNENNAMIIINTGDLITIDPENEEGLESENENEQIRVTTDGANYTDYGLEAIVNAGGVQGDGTLGVPAGASMPVEWAGFRLEVLNNSVNVSWTTATEKNNDFFSVERSTDGIQFEEIGQVQGAGTIDAFQNYSFVDEHPTAGNSYYRIRQIDYDGNTSLTSVEVVTIANAANDMSITVSGARQFTLNVNDNIDTSVEVYIFDMNGRMVTGTAAQPGQSEITIDLTSLQAGVYVCTTKVQGQTQAQKFVVR